MKYLRNEFDRIYKSRNLNQEQFWPIDDDIQKLVRNAEGMFIYASTVIRYVDDEDFHPVDRLGEIIDNSKGSTPFAELDRLYRSILGAHKNTELLLRVLSMICCKKEGWYQNTELNIDQIENFLQLRTGTGKIVLRRTCSVLNINNLSFYHKSFKDFIEDKERAQAFFIDIKKGHASMAVMLLRSISRDTHMHQSYDYAAQNWPYHCQQSGFWNENPQILEEISKTLDACKLRKIQIIRPDPYQVANFIKWLPADTSHPLDIRYRLFKAYWKQIDIIFACYGPDGVWLMKQWMEYESAVFFDYEDSLRVIQWSHGPTHDPVFHFSNSIVERRLQESKKSDSSRLIAGHAKMVAICLVKIAERGYEISAPTVDIGLLETERDELRKACDYANKYLTKHLSYVPPGNQVVRDAICKFWDGLWLRLSMDNIHAVRAWLQASGIQERVPNLEYYLDSRFLSVITQEEADMFLTKIRLAGYHVHGDYMI